MVYDIGRVPPVRLDEFRLRVHGSVDRPIELTWEEILALPCARLTRDFHCVTTWSVRDVAWEGVRAREIAERVSPHPGTQWVIAHGGIAPPWGTTGRLTNAHVLRRGPTTVVLTFLGASSTYPVWFSVDVARNSTRVRDLEMTAAGHFMHTRYLAWDRKVDLHPPRS